MNVFDLQAKIGLNSTEYKKGLTEASKSFSEFGGKIKDGAAKLAKVSVAGLTAVAGAATATTAAVLKGVDAYTSYGDSVDKMSQKLNMSAQAYQEWSAIMEHSGTSIDSMQASMKTLANAVETGNDAFERLGISQEEIASMNNEQLFSRTITALQNVENETERTYLAGQLLGRGATELGALLNTSAEDTEKMRQRVHELGGVMSDEAVKASAKYKDSIQDMKTAFVGMGRGLISDFVPALTEVSDGLAAIFSGEENGTERFLKGFNDALASLSTSADKLKPVVRKIGSIAVQVVPEIIGTVGEKIIDSIPSLLGTGEKFLAKIAESVEGANFNGGGIFGKILDSITSSSANYFEYGEKILANIGNSILNADYAKLGSSLSTIFTNALNSMSNLLADLDTQKVGSDIADFIKAIDWKGIAESAIDLFGSAIGSLGNIATGFFENMDGATLFTAIGVLGAPKILGGLTNYIGSSEGQSEGAKAGVSWSQAFMAGIRSFGLGWAIGTYIREEIIKSTGSEDEANEKITTAGLGVAGKLLLDKVIGKNEDFGENEMTFTTESGAQARMFTSDGKMSAAYTAYLEKQAKASGDALAAFNINEYRRQNGLIPKYGNGGRVTRPTIALVGEKEPETIVPDSKRGDMGGVHIDHLTMNINGTFDMANPEDRHKLIEEFSAELKSLSISQERALGGRAWA